MIIYDWIDQLDCFIVTYFSYTHKYTLILVLCATSFTFIWPKEHELPTIAISINQCFFTNIFFLFGTNVKLYTHL